MKRKDDIILLGPQKLFEQYYCLAMICLRKYKTEKYFLVYDDNINLKFLQVYLII